MMPVLDSPAEIYFNITGSTNSRGRLFREDFYPNPPILVSDQNVSGIEIDLGDIPSQ
jgi:hypothetical protein